MWTLCAIMLLHVYGKTFAALTPQFYPNDVIMGDDHAFVEWRNASSDRIEFQITALTRGWFGFGFSPRGGLDGADIVVGWVDRNGAHVEDRHGVSTEDHALDAQQDWKLEGFSKVNDEMVFRVSRDLITRDKNDIPITNHMRLIYFAFPRNPIKLRGKYYFLKFKPGTLAEEKVSLFHADLVA